MTEMKIRNGFVSNSSSSSFIIIGNGEHSTERPCLVDDGVLVIGNIGETQFGWERREYRSMWDKINFAYMQAMYLKGGQGDAWLEMLNDVLKKKFNASSVVYLVGIDWCGDEVETEYGRICQGYIDHQSASYEGDNTEMFDNEDSLERFLFCEDSYIQGSNDNDYYG